jgi:hypothetical protein
MQTAWQVAPQTGQERRGPVRHVGAVGLLVARQAIRDLEADRSPKPAITTHAQATHATDTPQPRAKKVVKKLLRKKASFRQARGLKRRPAQAPRAAAETPPWRNKAEWSALPEKQKWDCLPEAVREFAKAGAQSWTCKVKDASIECLLSQRAYWVRNAAEPCARHHAWLKNDGPRRAWESACRAAGVL